MQQPGWILGMWVAAAAAMLGVLVAAATGGSAPYWWVLALLVAVPGAVSVAARFQHQPHRSNATAARPQVAEAADEPRRKTKRSEGPSSTTATDTALVERAGAPLTGEDWDVVCEISLALGPQQLEWLRSTDFEKPWLDSHARAVVEVEPLLARVAERPFAPGLGATLRALADAVHAFTEDYSDNTFPDPLLRGGDWRFFEWDDRVQAAEDGDADGRWAGRAKRLQQLAEGVALAYKDFRAAAKRNPNVRRRMTARA